MAEDHNSAAALRARLAHHQGAKAAAEAESARNIAERAEAGALLSDAELDAIEIEIARLMAVIERAGSRVEMIRPALAAAEAREADTAARRDTAAERAAFAGMASDALGTHGSDLAAGRPLAQAVLGARGPVVSEYNPALFDEKPPFVVTRVDEAAWSEARDARLRAEGRTSEAARR